MNTRSRPRAFVRTLLALLAVAAVLAVGRPPSASATPVCPGSTTLYVNASVSGGAGDGSSWPNAYASLAAALTTATNCPTVTQIWVAQGTYTPTTPGGRDATFTLKNNLAIYGGFTSGQVNLTDRNANAATNNTVLSGDLGGGDHSYHVLTGSGTDNTAILDGFTVTGGNANGTPTTPSAKGGGMLNVGGSPTLTNVTFRGNSASQVGGGMANIINVSTPSRPVLTNVIFSGNTADSGGGMQNDYSNPILFNVVFSGNRATFGGAIYNAGNPPSDTPTALTNVTFSGNSASTQGGAVFNVNSSVAIRNSILWGDSAPSNSEIFTDKSSPNSKTRVSYSIVQGSGGSGSSWWDQDAPGQPGTVDVGNNLDVEPMFIAPPSNLRLQYASPAINAGNNTDVPNSVTTDLDGNPRIVGGTVDMGAYESPCPAQGRIIYVNGSASGSNTGASWLNAYTTLSAALAGVPTSPPNACAEIWVAQGTYTPTTPGGRDATFTLKSNVAIYGGFTSGQTLLSQRNWRANVTTLSGDIGTANDTSDNSYHVVTGSGTNSTAILDGFTITGGNANNSQLSPAYFGGGMYNTASSPTLTNLTISGNYALYGGGMYNTSSSSPTLTNVTISGNRVYYNGGGMHNYGSSSPTLTGVTFSGNSAGFYGGGIANDSGSHPTIRNSILWGDSGGEIADLYQSTTTVVYSIVQGLSTGAGNLNADPLFVTPITAAAPTTSGNLRLQYTSPAVNVGNNALIPPGVTTDLDGAPRIAFTTVDMGAYEVGVIASPTQSPAANAAGWNNTDVTVTWHWRNTSGAVPPSADCPATTTSSGEGTLTVSATCTDSSGSSGSASYTVKVDKTAPSVTLNPSANSCTLPGNNGWCRGQQTAGFTASDAGSGVISPPCSGASCDFTQSTTANGSAVTIASGQVCDVAGNCTPGINAGPFQIDSVAPTLTPTISPNPPTLGGAATASPNAGDATSGIASQSCDPVNTSSVGAKTLTCTATDNAGNTNSVVVHYSVGYAISTVSPIAAAPSVNSLYLLGIGTTATPIKWTLKNAAGTPITAAGTVTGIAYKVNPGCGTFPTDPTGATAASVTGTNPKYDTLQKAWVYNWILPGRGCYSLFITLNSGQTLTLFYRIY